MGPWAAPCVLHASDLQWNMKRVGRHVVLALKLQCCLDAVICSAAAADRSLHLSGKSYVAADCCSGLAVVASTPQVYWH